MFAQKRTIILVTVLFGCGLLWGQRTETLLDKGWKFLKGDNQNAIQAAFDDSKWEGIVIPHDWAIYGPFDRNYDLQTVAITQNGEKQATVKTGRSGGLPYVGIGWYRTSFDAPVTQQVTLLFDGAMSEAHVYVNGREACFWPYGYNSFYCNITDFINKDGKRNILAVRLENRPESSRWYCGAGLYRNVHLITTNKVAVPVWGTCITTPHVGSDFASICLKTTINQADGQAVHVETRILAPNGQVVAQKNDARRINHGMPFEQNFIVQSPQLWTPESPFLYKAVSKIYVANELVDTFTTRFGIRSIEFVADKGFYLNGKLRKFQGVCNHHDLGPLGAAVNTAALRRQLTILKDMGCDAIRTAHNMPAPELVSLCDEMGFMMMLEPFDEWDIAKCKNGYHRYFKEWAEKDMTNMLLHYRNNPSVIMWSIGNEVPTQCSSDGYKVASFLQDICHRLDPTRPVTCGMDQVSCVLKNGFAASLDIPGFNYRTYRYKEAYEQLPQNLILGSETASTVSSRGVYKLPADKKPDAMYPDHQSSSYDLEYCSWSNLPDEDFVLAEDNQWTIGQFVWTGFDYLGEPSPYDTDAWPSHSSLFGIIDLAGLPKDRYYLYRSVWNHQANTLHILPYWNWEGHDGEQIPVFVYTNYPSAELFINGKSYGRKSKTNDSPQHRYRLMWRDVPYQPGEVRVVAYDNEGKIAEQKSIHTAGKPYRLELIADRNRLTADGKDLAFIRVRVVDKDGNLCPKDASLVSFAVRGAGIYKAAANGDATCLDPFHLPYMHAFSGELTFIVQTTEHSGEILLEAHAKGLKTGIAKLRTEK